MNQKPQYFEVGVCPSGCRSDVVRFGFYHRKSDCRMIRRYRCRSCGKHFSDATVSLCYRQKKRQFNFEIFKLLCSGVSLRRAALHLSLNRKTVVRKFCLMGEIAVEGLPFFSIGQDRVRNLQFDDMETFEHTKCKPLSITIAVDHPSRRILGFRVSEMPAKGKLSKLAVKKYGQRKDLRQPARVSLFQELKNIIHPEAVIKSDMNPHYAPDVAKHFPEHEHIVTKGLRGCVVGQGELKGGGWDPLFTLNHTYAMIRDNVKRLSRRTWCTTKKKERLAYAVALYAFYHNLILLKQ